MTVAQLLATISSREIGEWMAEESLRAEDAKKAELEARARAGIQQQKARRRR